jgi:hypothetical protein
MSIEGVLVDSSRRPSEFSVDLHRRPDSSSPILRLDGNRASAAFLLFQERSGNSLLVSCLGRVLAGAFVHKAAGHASFSSWTSSALRCLYV